MYFGYVSRYASGYVSWVRLGVHWWIWGVQSTTSQYKVVPRNKKSYKALHRITKSCLVQIVPRYRCGVTCQSSLPRGVIYGPCKSKLRQSVAELLLDGDDDDDDDDDVDGDDDGDDDGGDGDCDGDDDDSDGDEDGDEDDGGGEKHHNYK